MTTEDCSPHPLTRDLDRLEDVLLGARSRAFHDFIHVRLRDLLSVSLLWTAAEELPRDLARSLLVVERVGDGGWAIEVLDQCTAHGLRVRLPGDDRGDDDDPEGEEAAEGDQR